MCEIMEELNKKAIKELDRKHVQRMLKMGFDKQTIMELLDLTQEEFEELSPRWRDSEAHLNTEQPCAKL